MISARIYILITACALIGASLGVGGCAPSGAVSESAYRQALQLVDQATLLLRERRLEEADAVFALAYEMAPISEALDGRGCVAMVNGDLDRAEEYLTKAYQDDRTYDHVLGNLALVYELQGEPEAARALYQTLLAQQPNSAPVRHNLAALELDSIRQKRTATASDKKATREEFLKSAALSEHGVIADNITRLEDFESP
jgi:Flp pilus assembly protein TadD